MTIRVEPFIRPLSREEPFMSSRRATLEHTRRLHAGTLNIFSQEDPPVPKLLPPRHPHPNDESHKTQEFTYGHLRRVRPQSRPETPRGIHSVTSAAGKVQNIQVVGITEAYKDPHNIPTPRCGVRCSARSNSSSMRDILSYAEYTPASAATTLSSRPDSKNSNNNNNNSIGGYTRAGSRPLSRVVNYSRQERFCQAVRDHAQHRRGGVTEFYVNLARGRVGRISAITPVPTPREWKLEEAPPTHILTLANCRDQLQSLTGIEVTLTEMAELLWDIEDLKEKMGINSNDFDDKEDERLRELKVSYRDFSAAFGDNSANIKLATMKI